MRNRALIARARELRQQQTGPELKLWFELRAKRFAGAKFRRQQVIENYVVDFVCRIPVKLAIEVDGDTHASQQNYDDRRSRELVRKGYRVLRFTNDEIWNNLDGVLLSIQEALRTSPLPDPLP